MANRNFHKIQTIAREVIDVAGSFAPAGTGAVTDVKGHGFTVARTGVGTFTVTFEDSFPEYIEAWATLQLATAADQFANVGTVSIANKTMIVTTWDISSGAVADIAANANNRVNFGIKFRNTSLAR